ncbi:MAG: hypothetical protein JWP43_2538, partial [Ramlibacter sp.]|nr:hypothetical protein [Ramlibacter sp.]
MTLRGRTFVGIGIGLSILLLTTYALWKSEQALAFLSGLIARPPSTTSTRTVGETIVMRTAGGT